MFSLSTTWQQTPTAASIIQGLFGPPSKEDFATFDVPAKSGSVASGAKRKKTETNTDSKKFVKKLKLKKKRKATNQDFNATTATADSEINNSSQNRSEADGEEIANNEAECTDSNRNSISESESDVPSDKTTPSALATNAAIKSPINQKDPKGKGKPKKEGFLEKAEKRLKGSRFRILNEKLYTSTSREAEHLFGEDHDAFIDYHEGYREQMQEWPENPNKRIADWLCKKPKSWIVADMGCGEAALSSMVPQKVHSFDLVAVNDRVTVANISNVPLADDSCDVVVFCLSLMGTNVVDFLLEGRRILKPEGIMKIAEVGSRFENAKQFAHKTERLGFKLVKKEHSDKNYFVLFDFKKLNSFSVKEKLPEINLNPCLYKKR